ncbi:MAG: hypothetical protein ACRDHB_08200 [Actinomycetota bacterium]
MPESFGKRQRTAQRARKLAEREERRLAKKQQRAEREAGGGQEDWLGEPVDIMAVTPPEGRTEEPATESEEGDEPTEDRSS